MRTGFLAWALAAAFILSVGCGSVTDIGPDAQGGGELGLDGGQTGSDGGQTGNGGRDGGVEGDDFSLELAPTAIGVPFHEQDTVSISIDRQGDVGEIALSAGELPAGIEVELSPNPVPAGTAVAEARISVKPGAEPGAEAITIIGSAGQLERSATLEVIVETITITGTVRGGRQNVRVVLVGKSAVESGEGGRFSFADVAPPYDIYTVADGINFVPTVIYYEALTRPDPTIEAAAGLQAGFGCISPPSATIGGSLTGPFSLISPAVVVWSTGGKTDVQNEFASYTFAGSWCSGQTQSGTLRGLQWTTNSSGAPDAFSFGQTNATLSNGGTHTVNVSLSTVTAHSITGTITPPANLPTPSITLTQRIGDVTHVLWEATTQTVDTAAPNIAAGTAVLHAESISGARTSRFVYPDFSESTDVSFELRAPPQHVAPAQRQTGIDHATSFQFLAPDDGVARVVLSISQGNDDAVAYEVITTAAQTTIPIVPEVPLPAGRSGTWAITSFGPLRDIDAAASETGLPRVFPTATGAPRYQVESASIQFTTAP